MGRKSREVLVSKNPTLCHGGYCVSEYSKCCGYEGFPLNPITFTLISCSVGWIHSDWFTLAIWFGNQGDKNAEVCWIDIHLAMVLGSSSSSSSSSKSCFSGNTVVCC